MRLLMGFLALSALAGAVTLGGAPAEAEKFQVEYKFAHSKDGANPASDLIIVGGQLVGAASAGGHKGAGTLFSYAPATGSTTVLYEFKGGKDGAGPTAGLTRIAGKLYGTTSAGGASGCGTVFDFEPAKGVEKVLYAFKCGADGSGPSSGLTLVDGKLYGVTGAGGADGLGTVFSVDPATGAKTTLHAFSDLDDSVNPQGRLTYVDSKLYGVSVNGGQGKSPCGNGCGTVFSIDPVTGEEALVHIFQGSDGAQPEAGMTDVNGTLYGTTAFGGATANCPSGCGVVYSLIPATGVVEDLYVFKGGVDGQAPFGEVESVRQKLYGTTTLGGVYGFGTVFTYDFPGRIEKVVHSFHGRGQGSSPVATVIKLDHLLYGTATGACLTSDCGPPGTIFAITP